MIIGIAGNATSGKDSLYLGASRVLSFSGKTSARFAFADRLKSDLEPLVSEKIGVDLHNLTSADKTLIRPLMVAYGMVQRERTMGQYWINALAEDLAKDSSDYKFITDVRFFDYDSDEVTFIKGLGGYVVYLEKELPDGTLVGPANDEEARNNVKIKESADLVIRWKHLGDSHSLLYYANLFASNMLSDLESLSCSKK
jgi:hypothetical protein